MKLLKSYLNSLVETFSWVAVLIWLSWVILEGIERLKTFYSSLSP